MSFSLYIKRFRQEESRRKKNNAAEVLAPPSSNQMMPFYTGGPKRHTMSNVDARNFLADAFLQRGNAGVASAMPFMAAPPAYHYPHYNEYDRSSSRSRRSRSRCYHSDSSDYSTPVKKKKRGKDSAPEYDSPGDDRKKPGITSIELVDD